MLWLYTEDDSYFGPELTKRMHNAFTAAGGNAVPFLFPCLRKQPPLSDQLAIWVPLWAPLVSQFLEKHSVMAQREQAPSNSAQNEKLRVQPPRVQLPPNIRSSWRKLLRDGRSLVIFGQRCPARSGRGEYVSTGIERPEGGAARCNFRSTRGNLAMGVKAIVNIRQGLFVQFLSH